MHEDNDIFLIKKGFAYAITSLIATIVLIMGGTIWTLKTDKIKEQIKLETHIADKYAHENARFMKSSELELYLQPIIQRLERIENKIDEKN